MSLHASLGNPQQLRLCLQNGKSKNSALEHKQRAFAKEEEGWESAKEKEGGEEDA